MKNKTLFLLIFLLLPLSASAGPANPGMAELSQPDGKKIKTFIKGDEFQHWRETEQGYTIIENRRDGFWEYADEDGAGRLKATGVRVDPGAAPPEGLKKHLKPERDARREKVFKDFLKEKRQELIAGSPSSAAADGSVSARSSSSPEFAPWDPVPVSGSRNLLIILVNFNNRSLSTVADDWNAITFNTASGARSVVNFYKDNSLNQLTVTGVSHTQSGSPAGILTVGININHPNGDTSYATETAWINAALAQAAAYVDFPAFDTNQDGIFQNSELLVYFVCSGYEESTGAALSPKIWAHAWGGSGVTAGGVALRRWALNGELYGSGIQMTMGVIAHELGHSMAGLPDLYDTSYTNKGLGCFSVMAAGSWGRASADAYYGMTPVSLDAWSRQYVGWATPRSGSAGSLSFAPALASMDAPLKLRNSSVSASQYFLIENRYSTGWDLGMERNLGAGWGGGLLIIHVDEAIGTPANNDINRYVSGSHQGVMAEEASTLNGSLVGNTSSGSVTHLFWNGNNVNFTNATSPDSRLYGGTLTDLSLITVSARSQTMTAYIPGPPSSMITSPSGGATLHGRTATITGTAVDNTGLGIDRVEVSTDGGGAWTTASGAAAWNYTWTLPADGNYTVRTRAKDNYNQTESPGAGIDVTVDNSGVSELQHYNWNANTGSQGCAACHHSPGSFVTQEYKREEGFCRSCHNAGGTAHESPGRGGHPVLVNASTALTKKPAYGSITTAENDNRPYANLKDGKVVCVTCHNSMNKYEDYGRTWEYTTTGDNRNYNLQRTGWDFMGRMTPRVYRDTGLWSEGGPAYSREKKNYLVDPAEYVFNEYSGIVRFNSAQAPSSYIYVSLGYPYLRASSQDNRLCLDCHRQATHRAANCLSCHQAHNTANIKGVRDAVRTPDRVELPVRFVNLTGAGSFADGDMARDGICEVCHTQTKYYRRDGGGFPNHSGGFDYSRKDCTACHSHSSGFAR